MNREQVEGQAELLNSKEFEQRVIEIIIADIKQAGPIRMALVGVFPESERKQDKPDA